ncbi:MAG: PmbA protein [Myxococcota bacterium]|jgi:PmbA protein
MSNDTLIPLLTDAVNRARALGATYSDAVAVDHTEGSVRVRLGEIEEITRARQKKVGLRIIINGRQAISASSDLRPSTIEKLVDDTFAMAKLTAADPVAGLPAAGLVGSNDEAREGLADPEAEGFDLERGVAWAREAEVAAMTDDRITNSEGGNFGFSDGTRAYVGSHGASDSYRTTSFGGWVIPIATVDGAMERDYHYSSRHYFADLESAAEIGRIAAERTLRRLGARRAKTGKVPVIFDQRMASSLLGYFAGAASGYALYRGASYLANRLGKSVASANVTIVDNGGLPGGPGSRPYDGEGLASRENVIVAEGTLEGLLLDAYSGRKLGMESTGNATRSVGDAPTAGPSNFHMLAGEVSAESLFDGVKEGFYVTELIGYGVNATTGDYSQGASGLWIVDGKVSHAVNEVTIAGNLLTMLQDIELVADDLDVHQAVSAPSFRISELMVAGE